MKTKTKERKRSIQTQKENLSQGMLVDQVQQIIEGGKQSLDALIQKLGQQMAETLFYMEREQLAGPDYQPRDSSLQKWASQPGSVYVGKQKMRVERPRLRGPEGEVPLKSYEQLKRPGAFSEELLGHVLRGLSARKYEETLDHVGEHFGISPSTVSRHIKNATLEQWKAFKERDLTDFDTFAVLLDTIHRAGSAFVVALGIDRSGHKQVLGFWEGASENAEVGQSLFADLEQRGLAITQRILWVSDGGKGLIKVLRQRFGKKLIHQRCTIHKDRNIQLHLPKRFRDEAHRRFRIALEQNRYEDAKEMLMDLEKWLRGINESAADSLLEAMEEILTLHRLKVPDLLRRSLHSTNLIESIFSKVRDCEGNIKRYRNTQMAQRWLAAIALYAEQNLRTVKGYKAIKEVVQRIEREQEEQPLKAAA